MSAADKRRNELLLKTRERVITHNKKVMEVVGQRASSHGNQKLVQLEQKVSAAEERRAEMQKKILDRVAAHNKKVMETRRPEQKKTQLEDRIAAAEERRQSLLQKNIDRVVDHNKRVMERRRTLSSEMHDSRKSLCMQLETK